jgi:hypothetical protein
MITIILPAVLFTAGIFYSGHLFVVSIVVTLGAWRVLSFLGMPALTLEAAPDTPSVDRKGSMLLLGAMLAAAVILDGFIASRFEEEDPIEEVRSAGAPERER